MPKSGSWVKENDVNYNDSISNRLSNMFAAVGGEIFNIPGLDDEDDSNNMA